MMASELPIDIHYNKLSDWLVSRRHCAQQWQSDILIVREKINHAIQDMPPAEEITQLLIGTYINYFHCLRIVELLKDTESSTKNIFGVYSSKRMKDWQEIVKLYEKNGLYLAESAQLLTRNVNYEIPSLKRQIAACQQTQKDCLRKEGEHSITSADFKDKFRIACKKMGIHGTSIKRELIELVLNIPSLYSRITTLVQDLKPAISYYSSFVEFLTKRNDSNNLPLLNHILKLGDTTVYEWRTGEKPLQIISPDSSNTTANDYVNEEQASETEPEIDFGDDEEIDFECLSMPNDDMSIEVVEEKTPKGVAVGSDALTLLDYSETRTQFVNELMELEAFLSQRCEDVEVGISSQLPTSVLVDTSKLHTMLNQTTEILSLLTDVKTQDLLMIRSSPRYVDRVTERLQKLMDRSNKALSMSKLMVTRRQEAVEEAKLIEPKINLIRKRTKELQKQIEDEISKKYQNRRVNIMGEINTV